MAEVYLGVFSENELSRFNRQKIFTEFPGSLLTILQVTKFRVLIFTGGSDRS